MKCKKISLVVLLFMMNGAAQESLAQKEMLIETVGKVEPMRIYPGEDLLFRRAGYEGWQEATLVDLLPQDSIILLDKQYIRIGEIEAIRFLHPGARFRRLGNMLLIFGASWLGFTAVGSLADRESTDWTLAAQVAGGSISSGLFLRYAFRHRTYRIGKRRRIRLLDLEVLPPEDQRK